MIRKIVRVTVLVVAVIIVDFAIKGYIEAKEFRVAWLTAESAETNPLVVVIGTRQSLNQAAQGVL